MSPSMALGVGHLRPHLGLVQVCVHKRPLELPVNLVLRGIAVGIRPHPAVVLDRGVQRLRCVAHVVAQPAGIEDGRLPPRRAYPVPAAARSRYSRSAAFSRSQTSVASQGCRPIFSGRWPAAKTLASKSSRRRGKGPSASAGSRSIKCSGAWAAFNSGSAGDRQRSGSGPRYSISLTAASERRNGGTLGRQCAGAPAC